MSLVCGLPFFGGIAVAADRSYLQSGEQGFGYHKLAMAGGALFSLTGPVMSLGPDGRRMAFSLQHFFAHHAPPALELQHLPDLVPYVDAAWQKRAPIGQVVGMVWWPGVVADFVLTGGHEPDLHAQRCDPGGRAQLMMHGRGEAHDVLADGSLSASSRALLARKPLVRDITRDQAVSFVLDFQAAAARHVPQAIGGGVDVRVVTPAGIEEVAA